MDKIYANLVYLGKKNIEDVPLELRDKVELILEKLNSNK